MSIEVPYLDKCNNFWMNIFQVLDSEEIDIETFFLKAIHLIPHHATEVERLLRIAKKKSILFEKGELEFKEFSEAADDFVFAIMQADDLMKGL